jgi:ABC-type Mn2+/Zn2+ transport system permease subunit
LLVAVGGGGRRAGGGGVGIVVSILGMLASYQFDLPTGATVVTTFGAALGAALVGHRLLGTGAGSAKPGGA